MARLRLLPAWAALAASLVEAGETKDWKAYAVVVETTTLTVQPSCAPPLTVKSTQYVPTTIFETIIYTDIVTTTATESITETEVDTQLITETTPTTEILTEFITETTPVTQVITEFITETLSKTEIITQFITETTPTTESLTLTATEKQEIHTSTTRLTSIRVCPTRVANPTFTVRGPLPTDWTWGCPPGWLCKPSQQDCDFEAGIPDRNFYCAPNECIPAEALPKPLQTWDDTIYGNSTPLTDPSLGIIAIDDYFNMDPTDFGLTYDIFIVDQEITYTETILLPPNPTTVPRRLAALKPRQGQTSIPGQCYTWCNNGLLEVQSHGKTPEICEPGSAFLTSMEQCQECIDYHSAQAINDVSDFVRIAPQFQQFLDYCNDFTTTTVQTSITSTTVSGSETLTSVLETTSLATILTSQLTDEPSPTLSTEIGVTEVLSTLTSTLSPAGPPATYTGSQITSLTVIMPTGASMMTLAGLDLEGATLILPHQAVETEIVTEVTSSYTSVTDVRQTDDPSASQTLGDETSAINPSARASQSPSGTGGPEPLTGSSPVLMEPSSAALILAALLSIGIFV